MPNFVDHLSAEIQALERSLETDPRSLKLRELRRVMELYTVDPPRERSEPSAPKNDAPHRKAVPQKMSAETREIVQAVRAYLEGRTTVTPIREIYHHLVHEKGIPVAGKDPISNLSAILSRYGFESIDRAGWRIAASFPEEDKSSILETEPVSDPEFLCTPRANGVAPLF